MSWKVRGKSRWIWSFVTSPCVGLVASRRELRPGARLAPLCGIPKYLDEQVSKSKTLPRSPADSLSLRVPPQVSMHKLDSFAEHVVQVRVYLIVWQSAVFG